ncbi:hypothetical protein [Streptomyces sp. NPDC046759]|uniref:hypothetical protein n=1 Tax=Streptomyces sp. NPDC046759 TaxID=3155019 RepID=UPI0033FAE643
MKSVEESLNLIPSISEVKITGVAGSAVFNAGNDPARHDNLIQHPIPIGGRLEFKITIPARIQERLKLWRVSENSELTEFLVITELDLPYPCTFVAPLGQGRIIRPSGAVIVLREFLIEELEKLGDKSQIKLTTLGPSPFHIDCHIRECPEQEESPPGELIIPNVWLRKTLGRGYARWDFFFLAGSFESPGAVRTALVEHVKPEFATYYRLTCQRNVQRFNVAAASARAEAAVATFRLRGARNWMRRVTRLRGLLRDLNLEILLLQMGIAKDQERNNKLLDKLRDRSVPLVIEKELAERAELNFSTELDTYGKVLEVLETQHTQTVQRITAFSVSLLGVIVGALLTAALRR